MSIVALSRGIIRVYESEILPPPALRANIGDPVAALVEKRRVGYGFPSINLDDHDRGEIAKIDITILMYPET